MSKDLVSIPVVRCLKVDGTIEPSDVVGELTLPDSFARMMAHSAQAGHGFHIDVQGKQNRGLTTAAVAITANGVATGDDERKAAALLAVAEYAVTVQTTNTPEWIEGLRSRLQAALDAMGSKKVCTFDGTCLRFRPACDHPYHDNPGLITPCPQCGEER